MKNFRVRQNFSQKKFDSKKFLHETKKNTYRKKGLYV